MHVGSRQVERKCIDARHQLARAADAERPLLCWGGLFDATEGCAHVESPSTELEVIRPAGGEAGNVGLTEGALPALASASGSRLRTAQG